MFRVTWSLFVVVLFAYKSGITGQFHDTREGLSLVNGTTDSGILLMTYDGSSGLLCAEGVGREEGRVACRDLGLPSHFPSLRSQPAPPAASFLGTGLQCTGEEIKLSDCRHDPWGTGGCPHRLALSLACKEDPCMPNPCQNDGVCVVTESDLAYQCNCSSAWTGLLCTTDVNECLAANGGCSELCVNWEGGHTCECPQPELVLGPDNHTCIAPGERVECRSDAMVLSLEKARFPSLHPEHLSLADPACRAADNATHLLLTAPLAACGTTSQQVGTSIVYKNVVLSREEIVQGMITRVKVVEIPFQCVMTLEEVREIPVAVDVSELHFLLEGTGTHDLDLQLSPDGEFVSGQGQASVYPGQQIYGQVTLTTLDPHLRVGLTNCSATTELLHNTTAHAYPLIGNGCPLDSTLIIANTTDSTHQTFHLEAFKFLDSSGHVAIHCDVVLCDERDSDSFCSRGCQINSLSTALPR